MKALEISTITVLHTFSKLNSRELYLLWQIAKGKSPDEIAQCKGLDSAIVDVQLRSLLHRFGLTDLSDMRNMLKEFNLASLLKQRYCKLHYNNQHT